MESADRLTLPLPQMIRHRRNAPPGYTTAILDEIDAKAAELISLLKRHWLPHQKSGFQTIKVRKRTSLCK